MWSYQTQTLNCLSVYHNWINSQTDCAKQNASFAVVFFHKDLMQTENNSADMKYF